MLKKIRSFIAGNIKKAAAVFGGAGKKIGRFIIEFEFYDSDFRHVLVEFYDTASRRFIKCAMIGARSTFKWRRHGVSIDFERLRASAGPDFIIKLTRPALDGSQPFVISEILLKAAAAEESAHEATAVSRFDPADTCIKLGFSGPYICSSKTVFSLNGSAGNRSAYLVFEGVTEGLKDAGFEYAPLQAGGDMNIIELFTSGAGQNYAVKDEEPEMDESAPGFEKASLIEEAASEDKVIEEAQRQITIEETGREIKQEVNAEVKIEIKSEAIAEVKTEETKEEPENETREELKEESEEEAKEEIKEESEEEAKEEIKENIKIIEKIPESQPENVTVIETQPAPAEKEKVIEDVERQITIEEISAEIKHEVKSEVNIEIKPEVIAETIKEEIKKEPLSNFEAKKTPEKKNRGGSQASKQKKEEMASGHFLVNFFSDGGWTERLNRLNPGFVKNIMFRADAILSGEYELNGVYFKTGEQIDWHNDFNYSRWPAAASYKNMSADFYSAIGEGPKKDEGIWPYGVQFAKNNEWVFLALAYRLSGSGKYALKIADLFKSFAAGNEVGFGINYSSDAACAERLVSWLMAFELIGEKYGALFNELGFHEYFNRQFDHIYERVVNRPHEANRHERIIALSCIYGVLLQVGGRIAPAVAKVYKRLKEEIALQFNPDGGHVSASPAFQLAVYKSLLYAVILSKKSCGGQSSFAPNSAFEDAEFTDAFGRMSRYLSAMAKPDGELANVADYYSYFFLPFDEFSPLDLKPSLQMASYLLMDGGLKFLTGGNKIAEIAMIFGEEGVERYNCLQVEVSDAASMRFAESGYFTLASPVNSFGRGNAATHFLFNTGGSSRVKDALKNLEFLAHNDLHNMILSHGGANFISDAGPALFVKNGDIARYKRTPSAHNCVVLNKIHFDSFCEYRLPESFRHFEDSRACLVSSTHKAYVSIGIEALVRRTVLLINGDYMLVMDDVFNGRKKPSYFDIDVIFHSPPDITVESAATINNKDILIYNSRSSEAKIINLTYSVQKVTTAVHRASISPFAGWHSDAAAQTNESASVIHSARFAKLPVRIYNLFYFVRPGDSVQALLKKIKMNLNKVNSSIDISHRDYKDSIKINEKFEVDFNRITVKI